MSPFFRRSVLVMAAGFAGVEAARGAAFVTLTTVGGGAYAAQDTNSCAIQQNNLTTYGGYQFVAYYNTARHIIVGRRATGGSTWTTYDTGISILSSEISDDHNVIAIGVDSTGYMHVSWNMHNVSLNYGISKVPVDTPALSSITFNPQTAATAPSLFPNSGATTNEVTYPVFQQIPGSADLLFTYRNGGAGGGSGNGNQYVDVYNPATKTFTNQLVINGEQTSVNAYLNTPAYDSKGNLLVSWTWRATPNWQTNSNIMYAQSPDNGTTWFRQGGASQYDLPIIQGGSPANSVGQVVKAIPQNSSFINQTSMTVDRNDNPIIATYYAPGSAGGNYNLQYMLEYYDGTQWRESQISGRTSDTSFDSGGSFVRDLGRPVVVVDKDNRVIVVTRSEDLRQGAYSTASTANNGYVIYWTDDLGSGGPLEWHQVVLDTTNLGSLEPTYDHALWESQNKLDLFFQPMGISGVSSSTVRVLEWDAEAYFATVPEPGTTPALGAIAGAGMIRPGRKLRRKTC